ncbi:hypothetical protein AB6Q56_13750 [Dechloromonas sp. ARDL1]|uniref:hypothetical protein n=1 Tax=Dechloromonas sp. ARDL1 TaxID=3322121 RepID=UPI003DA738C4
MVHFQKLAVIALILMAGACANIAEKTNTLSDEKIKSQTGGTLGYAPDALTIVSRRTEGTNTYVELRANDKKVFNCVINGGNALSFGMTNPPSCAKKGEPLRVGPFGQ